MEITLPSLAVWLEERRRNCIRIGATKSDPDDIAGWAEDERYFDHAARTVLLLNGWRLLLLAARAFVADELQCREAALLPARDEMDSGYVAPARDLLAEIDAALAKSQEVL